MKDGIVGPVNNEGQIIGNVVTTYTQNWHFDGGTHLWQKDKRYAFSQLIPEERGWKNIIAKDLNNHGVILANATKTRDTDDNPIPADQQKSHAVLLVPSGMAVDANRDGYIKFSGNQNNEELKDKKADQTSKEEPFRFWLNNDVDQAATVDGDDWEEDDHENGTADNQDNQIVCRRDLEDFARLWINARQVVEALGDLEGLTAELAWEPLDGGQWQTDEGSPAIRLYKAVETDGGNQYLQNYGQESWNQIQGEYGTAIGLVSKGSKFTFPADFFSGLSLENPCKYLLFEGVGRGKGKLVMRFKKGAAEAEFPPVYLELKDIKEFYENWTVGDGNVEPSQTAQLVSGYNSNTDYYYPFGYAAPQKEEEKDYVLLVLGWNVHPWEKERYAETMYKRLWHQGYQGRMGMFRWPCLTDSTTIGSGANDGQMGLTFDKSEYRAWKSAPGLLNLLNSLNSQGYAGRIRMLAHSQGNVVATEALRLANNQRVAHTYVASQAAIAAHCFDSSTPTLDPGDVAPYYFTTPNVYARYWEQGQSDQLPVLWPNNLHSYANQNYMSNSAGRFVNVYNAEDYALTQGLSWRTNQRMKPDVDYHYSTTEGFYRNINLLQSVHLKFPADRYEIFSFAAESQSQALGAQGGVGGVFAGNEINLQNSRYGFTQVHKYHSGQFRATIAQRWNYWEDFLDATNLKKKEQ
jgi:hypothetical protein